MSSSSSLSVVRPQAVLQLYRRLLRAGHGFKDYNFRHFVIRRTRQDFREARALTNAEDIRKAFEEGVKQAEVAERQRTVHNLFATQPSVMDFVGKQA